MTEIEERVIELILRRRESGRAKYGMTMERRDIDLVGWIRHLQEELIDAAIYSEKIAADSKMAPLPTPTVAQVRQYLERNGWTLEATRRKGGVDWHCYCKENGPGMADLHLDVTAMPEHEDFARWMAIVVEDLAYIERRNAHDIAKDIVQSPTQTIRDCRMVAWTKEPTVPGWYWVHFGDVKQSVSCLYVRMTEAGLTLGYQPIAELDKLHNMRWHGPITPPAYTEGNSDENPGYRSWR